MKAFSKELRGSLQTPLGMKSTLTTTECAEYLGISKLYLYRLCMRHDIPYWKSAGGKLNYFDRNEIDDWAKHRRIKTSAEIEAEAAAYCVTGKRKGK